MLTGSHNTWISHENPELAMQAPRDRRLQPRAEVFYGSEPCPVSLGRASLHPPRLCLTANLAER